MTCRESLVERNLDESFTDVNSVDNRRGEKIFIFSSWSEGRGTERRRSKTDENDGGQNVDRDEMSKNVNMDLLQWRLWFISRAGGAFFYVLYLSI